MSTENQPTVSYFAGIGARVLPTLLALEMASLPYKEVRYTGEQWAGVKADTKKHPTGTLPALTIGNTTLNQSKACALFAARAAGIIPSNPLDCALEEEAQNCFEELFTGAEGVKALCAGEDKEACRKIWVEQTLKKWMNRVEQIATGDKYFLAGDKPGLADFWIVSFVDYMAGDREWLGGLIKKDDFEQYKVISRIVRETKQYPAIKAYFDKHPEESVY